MTPLPIITVSGTLTNGGQPSVGYVSFRLTETVYDSEADLTYSPDLIKAPLDADGYFEVDLIASQGAAASPQGVGYKIHLAVKGVPRQQRYEAVLDESYAPGIDIADLSVGQPGEPVTIVRGEPGDPGLSAYQIAVNEGFVGSESDWLASLKGERGTPGSAPQAKTIEQPFPLADWPLPHNLGYNPNWRFEDSAHNNVEGVIEVVDLNNDIAHFNSPFAGWAYGS